MSRVAKKTDFMTISIYGVLAAFVIYFSAALGACFDLSLNDEGKADIDKLSKSLESTLMDTDLIIAQVKTGGKALQFPIFTAFGLGVYVLTKITSKKKFHRKGEEHGSARWANKKEILSLLDKPIKDKKSKSKSRDKPEIKEDLQLPENSDDIQTIEAPEPKARDEPDKAEQQTVHKDKRSVKVRKRKEKEFVEDRNIILTNDVKMSLNTRQTRKNLNVMVIGGSGSGKSRFYVKPNLMQANTSYVCTDPKGVRPDRA
mgnify:CR=1 FL=1